jgi:hypothetical protein
MSTDNMSRSELGKCAGCGIYLHENDHFPPHVHIWKGGRELGKIPLDSNLWSNSCSNYDVAHIPMGDLKKIKKFIKGNANAFTVEWNEIRAKESSNGSNVIGDGNINAT